MARIRIATIFGSLSLSTYIFIVCVAAMLLGKSVALTTLMLPLSLLEDLFRGAFDQSALGRDVLTASTLWLTFVCLIDLSMLLSSLDFKQSIRLLTANSYTKRLVTGLAR